MGDLPIEALDRYRDVFDDNFPTVPFMGASEDEIIEMINKCIAEKKDVYDMGYLSLDPDIWY